MKKIWRSRGFIINTLLVVVMIILIFVPDAKAAVMNGLMHIGFFKPDIEFTVNKNLTTTVKFKDGDGNIVDLSELKGKVVLLNFWATWCPPCRAEMPSLNKLYTQFSTDDNFVFITIDADNNYAKAKKFLDKKHYSLPLYTIASDIPSELFSGTLPTTIVLNKKGQIAFHHEGMADYNDKRFAEFIKKLSTE